MSDTVAVWQPSSRGTLLPGLAVPFSGLVMRRQRYEALLQDRLQSLIEADPEQAKQVLTGSPDHNPNLYQVAMSNPLRDWPVQMMMCDQMQIRLAAIDWHKGSRASLPPNEMPGLEELVETL